MSDPLDDEKIRKALTETARRLAKELGLDPDQVAAGVQKMADLSLLDQYQTADDATKTIRTDFINDFVQSVDGVVTERDIIKAIQDGVPHEGLFTLTAMALSKPMAVAVMYPVLHLMGCLPEKMRTYLMICFLDETANNPQRFDEFMNSLLDANLELFKTYKRGFNRVWLEHQEQKENTNE